MKTQFTTYLAIVAWLSAITQFPTELRAQERFRSESWQFDRRASVHDLNTGSSAERYKAALGFFIRSIGRRDDDGVENAIETMEAVYDEARSRVRTEAGRRELAIFEAMLGWFYMGLAETENDLRDKEYATRKGLRYLDVLLREYPDNLDVLFLYVRSTWFVPTTYEDLTKDIQYAGKRFLSRSSSPNNELDEIQRNVVLIALANVSMEENDMDSTRSYFHEVNSRYLRALADYGCGRLADVYRDIEQALRGRSYKGRVRLVW